MALERIANVTQARPLSGREGSARQASVSAGDTLQLAYADTLGEDLLVIGRDGRRLRLSGLGALGGELSEGDMLLVRVLRNAPSIELELLGSVTRSGRDGEPVLREAEQAAMRLDQAVMRQIAWRAPDAAVLANTWRALVSGQWREQLAQQANAEAGYSFSFQGTPASNGEQRMSSASERWAFPVYAWGGLPILLRVVHADPDERRDPGKHQMRSLAVRIEFELPGLGRILLQVQWLVGGVQLSLFASEATALAHIRNALPSISTAFSVAGLRMLKCRLNLGMPDFNAGVVGSSVPQHQGPAESVAPALFRAAAEVVVLLMADHSGPVSP